MNNVQCGSPEEKSMHTLGKNVTQSKLIKFKNINELIPSPNKLSTYFLVTEREVELSHVQYKVPANSCDGNICNSLMYHLGHEIHCFSGTQKLTKLLLKVFLFQIILLT